MKSKLFSSKSKSQPQVEIPQGFSSSNQGPRFPPPEQGLQPDAEGQAEQRPGQRHFSVPTIDSVAEAAGPTPTYSRELRGDRPPEQRYSTHILLPSQPPPPIEKEPKRGFRDRLGIGHSSKPSVDQGQTRATGLGRTLSVRRKDPSNPDKFQSPTEEQQRGLRGNSSSQLLVHNEEEESQHNKFTIQHSYPGSALLLTDQQQNTAYIQGPLQQQGQIYYPPPPLAHQLIDTDNSIQSTPEAFSLSPAGQHLAYLSEGQGQLQQFPPPLGQQELQQDAYQAPPIGLGVSAPPFQGPPNTASSYAFQAQPQDPQITQARHQQQQQDPQSAFSGRSSFETYQKQQQPQPQQYYPSPDPQRLPQTRISSNTAAPNQDPAYLQAPQGTSTAIVEPPPSPLQQPVPDQQISSQSGSQEPSPTDSQTGTSTGTTMPTGQPRGGSMRQVDKALPPPARESSMLGQRDAQAAPGVQAFNSNVVPIGSRGQPYREGAQETDDRGRDSPTRELTQDEVENYMRLVKEHKELKDKYTKVKKYYFEKESQVHHLQNTLANQRLSQSRTSLDDSEYTLRFSRLDGLISQLAFSIRKNWRKVPDFLERCVNKEAMATGKQEMTAVGRAYISSWLVSEIFEKYFHPDLDITLSKQLRHISLNIRRNAPFSQSAEEEENLQSKLINWRLTTLEGLQDQLKSPAAAKNNSQLVEFLNHKLVEDLSGLLQDPAPPDLQSSIPMIVELAINIAIHLPCESREVVVEYYMPGTPFVPELMKLETGVPALINPIESWKESSSDDSVGVKPSEEDTSMEDSRDKEKDDKGRRGMFGGLMMGAQTLKKPPVGPDPRLRGSNERAGGSQTMLNKEPERETSTPMKEERVRMAVGVSVQIRGRSLLAKAPVYIMA